MFEASRHIDCVLDLLRPVLPAWFFSVSVNGYAAMILVFWYLSFDKQYPWGCDKHIKAELACWEKRSAHLLGDHDCKTALALRGTDDEVCDRVCATSLAHDVFPRGQHHETLPFPWKSLSTGLCIQSCRKKKLGVSISWP
ncbi:hypothetical protein LX32DRAFT_633684 [Colletotrichum zoysiae]|uniref:Uncharacterized protein n=1 Tax=Colletotrichum zoysiae TaxID=1216348 RepID=A0AAD9HVI4_9PEZI|nr:hypothetical protein LX32DRAFT_633684 [Colletotrichum zoysiae]